VVIKLKPFFKKKQGNERKLTQKGVLRALKDLPLKPYQSMHRKNKESREL
jgi:hypothetical protein